MECISEGRPSVLFWAAVPLSLRLTSPGLRRIAVVRAGSHLLGAPLSSEAARTKETPITPARAAGGAPSQRGPQLQADPPQSPPGCHQTTRPHLTAGQAINRRAPPSPVLRSQSLFSAVSLPPGV
ncbi:hypothetical protein NDU88_009785 [Pleurodeles waltl]|uniref:Uncharacterized protein n=1 Tax=Pleurodeles waltl TaxID=8319 RepID=A0AAV7PY64_PLEWA|nr:hypothetical protein NDU88_009785 [Pleurodeles waltl]